MYEYKTKGTCSTAIHFDIRDGKVYSVSFDNGCEGNLKSISILAEGMEAEELIKKLKGVQCGRRGTSCGDQFARALERCRLPAEKTRS
ncbi:MAG: TIGR03905 family TSCPD domain-containing protein [Treponema sp.]|jgi:uncharacterized protein (TIGR03905 family)|nr:TIGR03905 family TSCPD domain-containing protein [Treponema sp.]